MERLYIIPHFHYDAAWQETYEGYLEICHPHILDALNILEQDPDYRFCLDQTALIEPFVQRYPEEAERLKRFVTEGRLELVGGQWIMPDANMPSGESYIRQMEVGKQFYREEFGVDSDVGWMLDVFGNHPQLPQLMRKAGFEYYVFGRVRPKDSPCEFIWRGIDGSEIVCHWMPYHYVNFWPAPLPYEEFEQFALRCLDWLRPYLVSENALRRQPAGPPAGGFRAQEHSRNGAGAPTWERSYLAFNGMDFQAPQRHVPQRVREFNARHPDGPQLVLCTPSEYFKTIDRSRLSTVEGDFNSVFQGCYTSRIRIKQRMREVENALTACEGWQVAAACLADGSLVEGPAVATAWKKSLFNHFHDVICGCHVNDVFAEAMRDFDTAHAVADALTGQSLDRLMVQLDLAGEGIPLVVFNSLPWQRTDVAECPFVIAEPGVHQVHVVDSNGAPVPFHLEEVVRYPDGGIKQARVVFIAGDVPALGGEVHRLVFGPGERVETGLHTGADPSDAPTMEQAARLAGIDLGPGSRENPIPFTVQHAACEGTLENEFYRLRFDPWTGALVSLMDKETGCEYMAEDAPGGNVITRERDRGDLWEINAPCRGGTTTTTDRPFPFPKSWEAEFSTQFEGMGLTSCRGAHAQFSIASPFGSGRRLQRVRVYPGMRRIDFFTILVNQDEWVRYRLAFPTAIRQGRITFEIPFGAIERPEGELPAQNWIDWSGEKAGLALLNRGIPGNNVTDGVMMLSLMRCVMNPGMESDGGFEKGVRHEFRYSLIPHGGDWKAAGVARAAAELNCPLVVRKPPRPWERANPSLEKRFSFLRVEPSSVLVSALRPFQGRILLRAYESSGEAAQAILNFTRPVAEVQETDLLGNPIRSGGASSSLTVEGPRVAVRFGPFEIKTVMLRFA